MAAGSASVPPAVAAAAAAPRAACTARESRRLPPTAALTSASPAATAAAAAVGPRAVCLAAGRALPPSLLPPGRRQTLCRLPAAPRPVGWAALLAVAAAQAACPSTGTVSAEEWQVGASLLAEAGAAGGPPPWPAWSQAWLPLGQRVRLGLEENLVACPEGAVAALLHSLEAFNEVEGEHAVQEVVKMLHHLVASGGLPALAAKSTGGLSSAWERHWLLSASAMVRLAYLKWVTVPQDKSVEVEVQAELAPMRPSLRPHHAFLFRNTVAEFFTSDVYRMELTEHSVLFSEAFAFVAFCRLHGVDYVVESGIYKGVSSEVWSLFVPEVAATDIFVTDEARSRLSRRSNVRLYEGDGRTLLPELLGQAAGRRTAVFIDGPKGELAIRLALRLREYEQVAFVAIHDMAPYRTELAKLGAFFVSDEGWYQEAYGHLDAPFHARPELSAGGTMAFL